MAKKTRVPSYRLHKPTGQAVVTLGGKDFYLGRWESSASKQEYNRLVGEWMNNGHRAPVTEAPLTVVELLAAYLAHAKTYYVKNGKPTGEVGLIKLSQRLVRQTYGHTLAKDFGPLALKALRQRMVEQKLCRAYINAHCDRIKRMFKWAASEEMVEQSVYWSLKTVAGLEAGRSEAVDYGPVAPVPDADVDATLPELPTVVRAMVIDLAACDDVASYLPHLTRLPKLKTLVVSGRQFGDEQLGALERVGSLQGLLLDSTKVSDEGVNGLKKKLPDLVVYKSQRRGLCGAGTVGRRPPSELRPSWTARDVTSSSPTRVVCCGHWRLVLR